MGRLSRWAITYVSSVISLGIGVLAYAVLNFNPVDRYRFFTILLLGAASSGFKVKLPMIFGTLSVSAVFIFFGVLQLTRPELIFLAAGSALVQTLWKPQIRPNPIQVSFNVSSMAVSAFLADLVFRMWPAGTPLMLSLASVAS